MEVAGAVDHWERRVYFVKVYLVPESQTRFVSKAMSKARRDLPLVNIVRGTYSSSMVP